MGDKANGGTTRTATVKPTETYTEPKAPDYQYQYTTIMVLAVPRL